MRLIVFMEDRYLGAETKNISSFTHGFFGFTIKELL